MLGEQFKNTYHMDASGNPVFYTDPQSSPDIHPRKKARYQELLDKHAAGVADGKDVNKILSPDETVELNNLHVDLHKPVVSPKPVKGIEYSGLLFSPETGTGDSTDPLYSPDDKRALAEKAVNQVVTRRDGTGASPEKLRSTVVDVLSQIHPKILQKTNLDVDELVRDKDRRTVLASIGSSGAQTSRQLGIEPPQTKSLQRIVADTDLRQRLTARRGVLPQSDLDRTKLSVEMLNAIKHPTVDDTKGILYWHPENKLAENPHPRVADPAVSSMYHELGHHMDPRIDAINTRTKKRTNIVREAYADGFRDREMRKVYQNSMEPSVPTALRMANQGYTPTAPSVGVNRASQALYVAVRQHAALGHSLPHFSEFQPNTPVRNTKNDEDLLLGHLYTHHQHVRDALKNFGLDDVGATLAAKYAKTHTDAAASPKWQQQEFDLNG